MPTTLSASIKQGFYERVILAQLAKMQLGRLNLSLPDGRLVKIGNGEGGIEANLDIKTTAFFKRCLLYGDIGFGEAYVEDEWETDNITQVIRWFLLNIENSPGLSGSKAGHLIINLFKVVNRLYHSRNINNIAGSRKNISEHYDLSNEFFALFLDGSMTYSSAYFKDRNMTLQEAQAAKYDRLCRQMNLKAGDHVLEIGSGWGGNAIHMAKHYGCSVTTVTISEEQRKMANERIQQEGLSDKITVILRDYRQLEGSFDKIVSIEMLEAVGAEFYPTYFKKCAALLKKDGVFALQTITCPDSRFESLKNNVDWIQKHIFPGSLLPSVAEINKAINATSDLSLVDLKDMGPDYAHTLAIWHAGFNKRLADVKQLGFDDRFIRKWNYYLCYCEAAFAMRNISVMQMVYTRPNNTRR